MRSYFTSAPGLWSHERCISKVPLWSGGYILGILGVQYTLVFTLNILTFLSKTLNDECGKQGTVQVRLGSTRISGTKSPFNPLVSFNNNKKNQTTQLKNGQKT